MPRIPRGRGLSLSFGQVLRIVTVAVALLALVVLQKPCAKSVSRFVTDFGPNDAGVAPSSSPPRSPAPMPQGVHIRSDMTPAEIEAAVAQAKAMANGTAFDAATATASPDAAPATPDAGPR